MPKAIVTSGPTLEKIDPVRFISNFSSGKQGHAIAKALYDAGYEVTLISGPVNIPAPDYIKIINVETAEQMHQACLQAFPVDVAVCAAAVCDFRPKELAQQKLKKKDGAMEAIITLVQNPDILKIIGNHRLRPKVVVGFAAETENLVMNAKDKLNKKNCDIIVANDVGASEIFGSDNTCVTLISQTDVEPLGALSKTELAEILVSKISKFL